MRLKTTSWLQRNSLVLAGMGLCLFSSGIDGAFMAKLMPESWGWLGLGLNAVADITGFLLTYWFGVFQQSGKRTRKYRMSWVLLLAEIVAVFYSWHFSYWQLTLVLPGVLPQLSAQMIHSVSMTMAGFVPLNLAFIGWAYAIQTGKWEIVNTQGTRKIRENTQRDTRNALAHSDNGGNGIYRVCEPCEFTAYSQPAWAGHCKGRKHKENMAAGQSA